MQSTEPSLLGCYKSIGMPQELFCSSFIQANITNMTSPSLEEEAFIRSTPCYCISQLKQFVPSASPCGITL